MKETESMRRDGRGMIAGGLVGLLMFVGLYLWSGLSPRPSYSSPIPGEQYVVIGEEDLKVTTYARQFDSGVSTRAVYAIVAIQGDTVRWKAFNRATGNNGAILDSGDYYEIKENDELQRWNVIRDITGNTPFQNSVTAHVIFYGRPS